MTKADIVERVIACVGFTRTESTELVQSVLEIITDTLANGETLKVNGFGSLTVKEKNQRPGRNPVTGEGLIIEARRVLTFKPSMVLRNTINGTGGKKA
jgi:integration host factor subunit alpha